MYLKSLNPLFTPGNVVWTWSNDKSVDTYKHFPGEKKKTTTVAQRISIDFTLKASYSCLLKRVRSVLLGGQAVS